MTEPLTRLLHDLGDDVTAPPPPASAVLREGHRLRRRRTALASTGAVAAVLAVLGGALLVPDLGGNNAIEPVAPPTGASLRGVTYAVGGTVYLDGGAESVSLPAREVVALRASSAGTVVTYSSSTPDDIERKFALVRPDGRVEDLTADLMYEESLSTDPDQPFLARSEPSSGGIDVVVQDLRPGAGGAELARIFLEGDFAESPPDIALDGDVVYVDGLGGYPPRLTLVDWRAGEVVGRGPEFARAEVADGRAAAVTLTGPQIVDVTSGEVLHVRPRAVVGEGRVDVGISLSPNGRYAEDVAFSRSEAGESTTQLVDLDTDEPVDLRVPPSVDVAWSAFDQPFWVDADGVVTVCDPVTGECVREERPELAGSLDGTVLGVAPYGP